MMQKDQQGHTTGGPTFYVIAKETEARKSYITFSIPKGGPHLAHMQLWYASTRLSAGFLLLNGGPVKPKAIVPAERSLIDVYGALCAGPVSGLQNWGQAAETTRGSQLGRIGQVSCMNSHMEVN